MGNYSKFLSHHSVQNLTSSNIGFPPFQYVDGTDENDSIVFDPSNYVNANFSGGLGDDTLSGSDLGDELYGDKRDGSGSGFDLIYAEGGNDAVYGGNGSDTIYAGKGDDIVYGDSRTIFFSDWNDYIDGGEGRDTIYGDGGNDTIFGDAGEDSLFGGDGNDTIDGGNDKDIIEGGAGDDVIVGGEGHDNLDGGAGNDQMSGGSGADRVLGGIGNDILLGDDPNDTLGGADYLVGGDGNDLLNGVAGNDALEGGEGDDLLIGGSGADRHDGGNGNDWASYEDATAGITLNLLDVSKNTGFAAGDTYTNIEVFAGSHFADTMWAAASGSTLLGNGGSDSMYGNIGNDHLEGGIGDDFLQGGPGDDTLFGGLGSDVYGFTSGEGIDRIVEEANGGDGDYLLVGADISQLSLQRTGDNLLFFANNGADVAILENWFGNQAVEAVYLQATGYFYSVADLVAAYLPQFAMEASVTNFLAYNGIDSDYLQSSQIEFSEMQTINIIGQPIPDMMTLV